MTTTTITRDIDLSMVLRGTFQPGCPEQGPTYASGGQPAEPDCVEDVEIVSVTAEKLVPAPLATVAAAETPRLPVAVAVPAAPLQAADAPTPSPHVAVAVAAPLAAVTLAPMPTSTAATTTPAGADATIVAVLSSPASRTSGRRRRSTAS